MGKRLIIPNVDFSENALAIPMRVTVAANQTITVGGINYTAGEEDTIFEFNDYTTLTNQYNKIKRIKVAVEELTSREANGEFGMFPSGTGITDTVDISECGKVYIGQYILFNNPVTTFKGFEKIVLGRKIFGDLATMLHGASINHKLITGPFIEGTHFKSLFMNCVNVPEIDCSSITDITNCAAMFRGQYEPTKVVKINLANANFDSISESSAYSNMFANCNNLQEVVVTNCTTASKTFLISRLADAGFTFTESTTGVLTKSI